MARGRLPATRGSRRGRRRGRGGLRGPSPLPYDSQAQRESGTLGNEAADTRAVLAGAYNRAQSQLGFGIGADSPYAASTLNREQLATNQRGIVNGSGRQLYAGSTLNKQSAARSQYDRNQKQIEDQIAEAQTDFTGGLSRTKRDELLGKAQITAGAIERAAASPAQPLGVGRGRGRAVARGRGRGAGQARQINPRALTARRATPRGRR